MAYRYDIDDYRYTDQFEAPISDDRNFEIPIDVIIPDRPLDEVTPGQITADQNDYPLPDAILSRFTTDAARTITGFSGAKSGIKWIANVGGFNLVLAHDSASSAAENRILSHSLANITLTPGQYALLTYDFTSARWRAGKLT